MEKTEHKNIINRIAGIRGAANIFIEEELARRGIKGVVPAHGSVFAFLFQQGQPVTISALVHKTGRAKSTVTGIVKTLERHGYLYRETAPEDARAVLIALTEKGEALKKDFGEISDQLLGRVYGDMSLGEKDQLMDLLKQVEKNMKK